MFLCHIFLSIVPLFQMLFILKMQKTKWIFSKNIAAAIISCQVWHRFPKESPEKFPKISRAEALQCSATARCWGAQIFLASAWWNLWWILWWWRLWLVGGLEHFICFHKLGSSSSQLTNIFQRGWDHQPDDHGYCDCFYDEFYDHMMILWWCITMLCICISISIMYTCIPSAILMAAIGTNSLKRRSDLELRCLQFLGPVIFVWNFSLVNDHQPSIQIYNDLYCNVYVSLISWDHIV